MEQEFTSVASIPSTNPTGYKFKLWALACLGYAVVIVVLLIPLGLVFGIVGVVFQSQSIWEWHTWFLLLLTVSLLYSLWFRVPQNLGIALTAEQAPQLYEEIKALGSSLKVSLPKNIWVDENFAVEIVQLPRRIPLGWFHKDLRIGLPLLLALEPAQLKSLVAQQLALGSRKRSRLSVWIFQTYNFWSALYKIFEHSAHRYNPSRMFIVWYAPKFCAYSLAQIRWGELESDLRAADVVGADAMVAALVNVEVKAELLHRLFWDTAWQAADAHPQPPRNPYKDLAIMARLPLDVAATTQQLSNALARSTQSDDRQPCLAERLDALKRSVPSVTAADPSAAMFYLKTALPQLVNSVGKRWQRRILPQWQAQYSRVQLAKRRLAKIRQHPVQQITDDALMELAELTQQLEGSRAAKSIWEMLLQREPGHPFASLQLGVMHLENDDELGIELVEVAMRADFRTISPGSKAIIAHLRRIKDMERMVIFETRYENYKEQLSLADQERNRFDEKDKIHSHGLDRSKIANLLATLKSAKVIEGAYLARKRVLHFSEIPMFVLLVQLERHYDSELKLLSQLQSKLRVPGTLHVASITEKNPLLEKLNALPHAKIL